MVIYHFTILHEFYQILSFQNHSRLIHLCPAQRAGVLNPLTRKIVFVRACVRRACVPHFLFVILQLFTSYMIIDKIVDFQIRREPQFCGSLPL